MILVRDIFYLKFGKAKDAKELIKAATEVAAKIDLKFGRSMTDLTGHSYTMVVETEYESLTEFEESLKKAFSTEEFGQWYQKFVPLVDRSSREIYTLI